MGETRIVSDSYRGVPSVSGVRGEFPPRFYPLSLQLVLQIHLVTFLFFHGHRIVPFWSERGGGRSFLWTHPVEFGDWPWFQFEILALLPS